MKIKQHIFIQHSRLESPNQAGFSLIELMVSMLIGIFLLAGVVTNFTSTKDTDIKRNAVSEMDANARNIMNIMRQTIGHAGYSTIYNIRLDKAFFTPEDVATYTNSNCADGNPRDTNEPRSFDKTRDIDGQNRDMLTVVSLADNPCSAGNASCPNAANVNPDALVYYDCMGGGLARDAHTVACSADSDRGMSDPTQAKIYSTFRLYQNNLSCRGSRTPVPAAPDRSGGGHILAENVEALQFLYGVKQANGSTVFRRASVVENNKQWGLVTSVQVGLLMRSSNKSVLKTDGKGTYTVLDDVVNIAAAQRRRLFRLYTTTINLENNNKGALL